MITKFNYYFLLNPSFWPLMSSINSFSFLLSLGLMLKWGSFLAIHISTLSIVVCSFVWWLNYSAELNLEGQTSDKLNSGIKTMMILFISSEVFFFFSFFWSYFHFFLSPSVDTGMEWPPYSLVPFDFSLVPLINTLVLLSSGVTVTASHHFINQGSKFMSSFFLILTISLGVFFTYLQGKEYCSSFFSIGDSTFGTSFFMLTGFHGIHVLIGTAYLAVTLILMNFMFTSKMEMISLDLASWYWHFVDVVWIFLYFVLYYMNS